MARRRRTSPVLETARQRFAGLKSIKQEPNFGDTLSLAAYGTKISTFDTKLDTYNEHLAALDEEQNAIDAAEEELRDWNRRMLSATEAQYGGDSSEYEVAGGKRTSERKRSPRGSRSTPPPKP